MFKYGEDVVVECMVLICKLASGQTSARVVDEDTNCPLSRVKVSAITIKGLECSVIQEKFMGEY